jgi:hypothetical protein
MHGLMSSLIDRGLSLLHSQQEKGNCHTHQISSSVFRLKALYARQIRAISEGFRMTSPVCLNGDTPRQRREVSAENKELNTGAKPARATISTTVYTPTPPHNKFASRMESVISPSRLELLRRSFVIHCDTPCRNLGHW